jgi:hypothetical protein
MKRWFVIIFFAMTSVAFAIEDTPENREKQVERYFKMFSMEEQFLSMYSGQLKNMDPEVVKRVMHANFDFDKMTQAIRAAIVKTLTADEIAMMADYYASPEGKSSMSKMGKYMAELNPAIAAEATRASILALQELTQLKKKQQ